MGGVVSSTNSTTSSPADSLNPNSPPSRSSISTDSHNSNSSTYSVNPNMSSSDSKNQPQSENPESSISDAQKTLESKPQTSDSSTDAKAEKSQEGKEVVRGNGQEIEGEEEEEEGECGFCLFMKGGGCKESFIAWEKCVEEAEQNKEDVVEKCFEATSTLRKCMEAHADYYEPILRAEKSAHEEAVKELEKEKESEQQKDSKGNGNVGEN